MFKLNKIRHYVGFMAARGFGTDEVLAGTGISAEQLARPDHLADFDQYRTVIANMVRLTGDQGIGFEVGNATELTDLGIVGHAIMSSKTARDALGLWLRYSNALVGMMITMRLDEDADGSWQLTLSEMRPLGFVYSFAVEELLLIVVRVGEALTKRRFVCSALELSYAAPAHHARYAPLFGCEPRFSCTSSRIRFSGPALSSPLKSSDEEFHALCLQHCSRILRQISVGSPVASRIRGLLLGRVRGTPTLEELADELGMSPRSLRRHLQAEGHGYKALVHGFRVDLAKEYLGASRMTAKETAYLLGFQDVNAFRRAFKLWTGQTIQEFREEAES